jgi:DNA-binding CsgD family transcriptional regulator
MGGMMVIDIDWRILSLWASRRCDTYEIARQLKMTEAQVANKLAQLRELQRESHRLVEVI